MSEQSIGEVDREAQYLSMLNQLAEAWRAAHADTPWSIPFLDGGISRGVGALTQVLHAVSSVAAINLLHANGMPLQAVPFVRTIQECAVTTVWLLCNGGSGEEMLAEADRQAKEIAEALDATQEDLDAIVAYAQEHNSQEARNFRARTRLIQRQDEEVYLKYKVLSGLVHAGANLLDLYFVRNAEAIDALNPQDFALRPYVMQIAAEYLLLALQSWNVIDTEHRLADALEAFVAEHGWNWQLPTAPTGSATQP